ncbi:hypothetical protein ACLOJK_027718 [Asimina triloba]
MKSFPFRPRPCRMKNFSPWSWPMLSFSPIWRLRVCWSRGVGLLVGGPWKSASLAGIGWTAWPDSTGEMAADSLLVEAGVESKEEMGRVVVEARGSAAEGGRVRLLVEELIGAPAVRRCQSGSAGELDLGTEMVMLASGCGRWLDRSWPSMLRSGRRCRALAVGVALTARRGVAGWNGSSAVELGEDDDGAPYWCSVLRWGTEICVHPVKIL